MAGSFPGSRFYQEGLHASLYYVFWNTRKCSVFTPLTSPRVLRTSGMSSQISSRSRNDFVRSDMICKTTLDGWAWKVSVPKILTPYIPEILSLPAIAGKVRNLPMLRFVVVSRAERREEDVRDVEATRDRSLAEGWPREDRGGPFGGSFAELRQAYRGRRSGRPCR